MRRLCSSCLLMAILPAAQLRQSFLLRVLVRDMRMLRLPYVLHKVLGYMETM